MSSVRLLHCCDRDLTENCAGTFFLDVAYAKCFQSRLCKVNRNGDDLSRQKIAISSVNTAVGALQDQRKQQAGETVSIRTF